MKKSRLCYIIIFFTLCLIPSAGMLVADDEASMENREATEFPAMKTEEGWNTKWLSEAGEYFEKHFAFRQKLITANAILNGKVFGVSSATEVIQGTNGWLYYKDSLKDYQGQELLSDRSLFNLAHSLAMTEKLLKAKGIDFVFAVAPNKNSLYGENMPYYLKRKISEESNLKNLQEYLEAENVTYVDLLGEFKEQEEVLYHKRDSHWNNKGAALASNLILEALSKDYVDYEKEAYTIRRDFEGDLDKMLYPEATELEEEIYYDRQSAFSYVEEIGSNFDPRIRTINFEAEGNLVMYRDSFGNALLPFMADAYQNAYFSRGVPYQITTDTAVNQADTVAIVRAERFIPEMAMTPPVLCAEAETELPQKIEVRSREGIDLLQVNPLGSTVQISGRILPEFLENTSQIYLKFGENLYFEAFPQDIEINENVDHGGFSLYLDSQMLVPGMETFEILTKTDGVYQIVGEGTIPQELIQAPSELLLPETEQIVG